jgi:1-acyl-sn-glycerol-3-phosphate acyltransferase
MIIIIINHTLFTDFYIIMSTENCHHVLEKRDSFYINFMINHINLLIQRKYSAIRIHMC